MAENHWLAPIWGCFWRLRPYGRYFHRIFWIKIELWCLTELMNEQIGFCCFRILQKIEIIKVRKRAKKATKIYQIFITAHDFVNDCSISLIIHWNIRKHLKFLWYKLKIAKKCIKWPHSLDSKSFNLLWATL